MFKVGDLVDVYIPPKARLDEAVTARLAKRFNHSLHYVTKAKIFRDVRGVIVGGYYELEDASSPEGIPYTFHRDWVREPED